MPELRQGKFPISIREVPSSVHQTAGKPREREGLRARRAYPVDGAAFPLGIGSPEHEHDPVQVLVEPGHHNIRELLPAPLLVGRGLVSPDREHSVEQEHSWQTKHIQRFINKG